MSFSLLSVVILVLFAVISGIEIYRGVRKGFMGALVSLGTVVLSLIVTLSALPLATNMGIRFLFLSFDMLIKFLSNYISAIIPYYEMYLEIMETFSSLQELLVGALSIVLCIISFVVVFFVLKVIFKIVFYTVFAIVKKRRKDDMGYCAEKKTFLFRHDKLMGGIVGAISAVILMMTLLTPFMGTLEIINEACEIVDVFGDKGWETIHVKQSEMKVLRKYYYDAPGSVFYHMGGKYMFRALSSTVMYNESISVFAELDAIQVVAERAYDAYDVIISPTEADPEDSRKITELGISVANVKIFRGILAEVLSDGAKAWRNGEAFVGISLPEMPSLIKKPFDEMLLVCEHTNEDSIKYNIVTLFNLYALVIDTDIIHVDFSDLNSALDFINDTDLIERVNNEFARNKYMSHIRVTSITMSAVAQQINSVNLSEEQYDEISVGLSDMINQINGMNYETVEEKAEVLNDIARTYVTDAVGEEVEIPDAVIEAVTIELFEELEGKENVTPEDIKEIFDKYSQQ